MTRNPLRIGNLELGTIKWYWFLYAHHGGDRSAPMNRNSSRSDRFGAMAVTAFHLTDQQLTELVTQCDQNQKSSTLRLTCQNLMAIFQMVSKKDYIDKSSSHPIFGLLNEGSFLCPKLVSFF